MRERETRGESAPGSARTLRDVALCLLVLSAPALGCGGKTGRASEPPSDAAAEAAGDAAVDAAADSPAVDAGPDTSPPSLCGIVADSGGGACSSGGQIGLTCCDGQLVNLENDPLNCGGCGTRCDAGETCTGSCRPSDCAAPCGPCQQCCHVNTAGPAGPPYCVDGPTCPVGCIGCT